ncbi:2-octaprenyl-3-methyl-6-methoxy-1,4-benzoquinol hydroxylase [Alteromonadaceae bacterium M269]|nr:2-octaprenyl-3-methyl-6-methoxy-1,4-benzoquinol hydroxylase [Alteromonadaceae bacterium M269]
MVGAAAALGLVQKGYTVAIIEKNMPAEFNREDKPDLRVSAISQGSQQLLDTLGAWSHVESMRACMYKRLSVWEEENCRTTFDAEDAGQIHLGYIVENRVIQLALHEELKRHQGITWINDTPVDLQFALPGEAFTGLTLSDGADIKARYLIGADGANSYVRKSAGVGTRGWSYKQNVLAISVKTTKPQQDITWQRFSPSGPRAFLPLYDGYASLVWYDAADQVKKLKTLKHSTLKEAIVEAFPSELGEFDILDVASFPITRMHATQYVKASVILIGDAAHTINPLAGQGVNLGFKDVKALLTAVDEFADTGSLISHEALKTFERTRQVDNSIMMTAMDGFYHLFSNGIGPLKALRNAGLVIADKAGLIKNQVMKYAMGM